MAGERKPIVWTVDVVSTPDFRETASRLRIIRDVLPVFANAAIEGKLSKPENASPALRAVIGAAAVADALLWKLAKDAKESAELDKPSQSGSEASHGEDDTPF